jgi:beta-glucosidase
MVLLKNEGNALPLAGNVKNIAAFGNTSYKIIKGGTGSGNVNAAYSISMIEGLQNAGYTVDKGLEKTYTQYMEAERAKQPKSSNPFEAMLGMMRPIPEMEVTPALAAKMAGSTDVALVVIGRNSGEGKDREVEGDFNLTDKEKALIRNVSEAFQAKGKKAIVILNIGGVIETASWRNLPDAILLAWQPGQEAGNSIADVVSGKVNPSGKLATTFPVNYSDVPSSKTFPGIELPDTANESTDMPFLRARPAEVVYEEDIYVGYRYYNTFNVPTAYEFGYGLSYTQFDFSNLTLNAKEFKDRVEVSVDIKNVGNVAGREVVQLYLGAPSVKLPKPSMELKGFAKTKLLQPGEVQTVKFTIGPRKLASYDTASSAWVAEAGEYTVSIGASSKDIRLEGSFSLAGDMVVEKAHKALSPSRNINVIKP